MKREAIGTAETLEKAKEEACKILGADIDTDRIEFDVIQMPEKKKLGLFGGKEAKVKAFIKLTRAEKAKEYIQSILESLKLENAYAEIISEDEESANIVIRGDEAAMLIGRRGESLDALQYLSCLAANQENDSYYRIVLDISDYRKKREETLKSLGRKHALNAAKRGYTHSFEPMNPYERRIIHTAVQEINGAISWSEGENIRRHVVIGPDPNVKQNYKRGGSRGSKYGFYSKKNNSTSFTYDKEEEKRQPMAVDDLSDKSIPLYSKIEVNSNK